ncbi:MAG: alkaline phosphatase family protein [Actinomycetota bacterium]|nr:alkaline phosphatase family protein [Actinomycetota bacterium]
MTGRWGQLAGLLALIVMCAGCGTSNRLFGPVQHTPAAPAHIAGGAPSRIAVVVMENEEYSNIIGSRATPYINSLARRYALVSSMFAVSHPSLPNYLALTGGSTFSISSDCTNCTVRAFGLGQQLSAGRIPWKAYMEGLPRPCFGGAQAGGYAKKHNPFIYYSPPPGCSHVVALSQLAVDERGHALPRFVWITPNLCHDMHDCSPATGDRFLSSLLPPLLSALGRRGLLILTWDEGTSDQGCCRLAHGGHVVTILAGSGARRGAQLRTPVDHYSTLQTIEDLFKLRRLRGAACACTPSLAPLLARRTRRAIRTS